ncbi:roadblock/LC7 domain-containing protein [Streptomyces aculeolatus]
MTPDSNDTTVTSLGAPGRLQDQSNVIHVADTGRASAYDNLRDNAAQVPGVFAIVLLSDDGLAACAYGLELDDAQTSAAASSGILSLGENLSALVDGGAVLHNVLSLERGHQAVATSCGDGSSLIAYVHRGANVGVAIGEIIRIARAFGSQMATAPRRS